MALTWSSSNAQIATVTQDGVVTGKSKGMATVTAKYNDVITGSTRYVYINMMVLDDIGLENGAEYNIMNYNSERYMSLESESDTNGVNVNTRERSKADISRWKIEQQSDKKYQLVNEYSTDNRVLDVTGTNVDIFLDCNANFQKFDIVRVETGDYKGYYQIRYGKYYVSQDSSYNVYLSTSLTASSYWSFMPVEKDMFSIYTLYSGAGIKTSEDNNTFGPYLDSWGYENNICINATTEYTYNTMLTGSDVLIFNCHGVNGCIQSHDIRNQVIGNIAINRDVALEYLGAEADYYLENLGENAFAELRCVLLLTCLSAADAEVGDDIYNLVDLLFDKGAHFVLGTTISINTEAAKLFVKNFMQNIKAGDTVGEAVDKAKITTENIYLDCGFVFYGDRRQYLDN